MMVIVAGVVAFERSGSLGTVARLVGPTAFVSLLVALPILPIRSAGITSTVNEAVAETVGWPELVDQVATVVEGLPEHERTNTIILAKSYGEAGAIDRFGSARRLPHAYSPHNGYAHFRIPTDGTATVITIRFAPHDIGRHFADCTPAGAIDNGLDVDNEAQGQPILVCRGLRGTWPAVWNQLKFLA